MDTSDLWAAVLGQLKNHPQTRAIYQTHLHGSTAAAPQGDTLTVTCRSALAVEWLNGRIKPVIEREAAQVYGRALSILFTASTEAASVFSSLKVGGEAPRPAPRPTIVNGMVDVIFHHGDIVGFSAHSHYLAQFVRNYIGAVQFDVWDCLRSMGKDSSLTWTRPIEITGIELARRVGCHEHRIIGVKRSCFTFDQAMAETGQPIACCGKHKGAKFTTTRPSADWPDGRPICGYKTQGALEVLEAEGWLVYRKLGKATKSVRYEVQIFQHLPLLTPWQAGRLPKTLQAKHQEFIYGIFKNQGLSFEAWAHVTAATYFALVGDKNIILNGLHLPLPKKGVLSYFSELRGLLPTTAHNHIFFDSFARAVGVNECAVGT